ncbi:hypothetical protein BD289DRAFT_277006 [Coniella lustricola]|uniref:Uncharacterized protein n=1 Tax=Coniella lustricola TaxID=2025994 RepID=A0A2T3A6D7_9PEZI|nr:hypothetical protein BD289DRAFT_277006 [Coniella lustricola]
MGIDQNTCSRDALMRRNPGYNGSWLLQNTRTRTRYDYYKAQWLPLYFVCAEVAVSRGVFTHCMISADPHLLERCTGQLMSLQQSHSATKHSQKTRLNASADQIRNTISTSKWMDKKLHFYTGSAPTRLELARLVGHPPLTKSCSDAQHSTLIRCGLSRNSLA